MNTQDSASGVDARREGMNIRQRAAFSFGNFGQSAFYNALSTYFVIYVSQTLFAGVDKDLAAKLIGVITSLVMVIRIAEIFLDPLLGNLIDNTTTRWGRFHPWQLLGGLVSAVLLVLVYTGLFGLVNVNTTVFIVLFVIVFVVLDVFYSLRDISYWGMVPALSTDSHERSVYTSLGNWAGTIGYNGLTAVVVPIVTTVTWWFTGRREEGQAGWTAFAIIVAILAVLTCLSVVLGTKESTSSLRSKAQKSGGPIQAFKALFENDQLLWVALSYLLYSIAKVITTGVLMLMFKFVLGMEEIFWIAGVVPVVVDLIVAPVYPVVNRYIPRRYLFLGGMVMMACGYLVFAFSSDTLPMVVAALILFYFPETLISTTAILCMTDSIEYGQLKTGRRNEAVILSVRPMLDKIAGALSNGMVGLITVAAGMISGATAADMTPANIQTFKLWAFYVPLGVIALGFLVFFFFVKLSEKKHAQIVAELVKKLDAEATSIQDAD
ncbi:MFS transporter [Bifidobacterium pullorum subsp. saeculare]|uniref:MFS transporter n=1 Tax=Bifidobacterium pullorum subsp. saeculare TaxID=78257 RepID=A0A938WYS4_9BIFI|nr:glycoside-pentoside-hexuronide (GPH):cation symporter [Bifidobacterium pullorum]MBM6700346.1 MFS transporter [Bifidobacterium pullorum subsp. saeculare]